LAKAPAPRKTPARKTAPRKTASKPTARKSAPPAAPNRERPDEPERFDATKDQLLEYYRQMLLIRRFEEKAGQLYGLGLIGGFCHLYIGQEAVAVGLQSALDGDKDKVITGYRDHGHMLAYGLDPKVIMAELTGRAAAVALDWVRAGKGPILLELKTYRYRGHSMSDPAKYRSREEVQSVRDKSDPIEGVKKDLEAVGVSEDEMKAIDKEIKAIVAEAADFAESSPEPDPAELYTDILVEQY
jgi:TPP-dependent pyruvate/acetoin dehydrogenase alpha subunit